MKDTDIFDAIKNNDISTVLASIDDIWSTDGQGNTALEVALRSGRRECAKVLMAHAGGLPIDLDLLKELSCLTVAARAGCMDGIKHYLADPIFLDKDGCTELMMAVKNDHPECVELLRPTRQCFVDGSGQTALLHAIKHAHPKCVRSLLTEAWIPNVHGQLPMTIMQQMIRDDRYSEDFYKACVECNAILQKYSEYLQDLWDAVTALDHSEMMRALHTLHTFDGTQDSILMYAARAGKVDFVMHFLNELNVQNSEGWTALMYAASVGSVECCELLLAEANRQNALGQRACTIAAIGGHLNIVEMILEHLIKDMDPQPSCIELAQALGEQDCLRLLLSKQLPMSLKSLRALQPTVLMLASAAGFHDIVELHLSELGLKDRHGQTALMYAAAYGSVECAALLLDEAWEQDCLGQTALMKAAAQGKLGCIKLLFEKEGCMQDAQGTTALMLATSKCHTNCIRPLLQESGSQNKSGHTALMCAAALGYIDIVRILANTDCGHQNELGITALMFAAKKGHTEIVSLLVAKESMMQNKSGKTALAFAVKCGHLDCVKLLLNELSVQTREENSPLGIAHATGNIACLRILLQAEVGLRALDDDSLTNLMLFARVGRADYVAKYLQELGRHDSTGKTALIHATRHGHYECVLQLLDEISIVDSTGKDALTYAIETGHEDCAILIMTHNSGLDTTFVKEHTPLMLAATMGNYQAVKNYLHHARKKDGQGRTALSLAAERGHQKCAQLLLDEACQADYQGQTALMYAARKGRTKTVQVLLLEAGKSTEDGKTALMFAAEAGNVGCVKLLLSEARKQDDNGMTALMYAARSSHKDVVAVLVEHEQGVYDNKGRPALSYAIEFRHPEIVTRLLSEWTYKWSPQEQLDDRRWQKADLTPKEQARQKQCVAIINKYRVRLDALLNGLVDNESEKELTAKLRFINELDYSTATILQYAKRMNHTQSLKLLLAKEGSLDLPRDLLLEKSILMVASMSGNEECATSYLDELMWVDFEGKCALMYAIRYGHLEIVKLLIREATIVAKDGSTALSEALARDDDDFIIVVLQALCQIQPEEARAQNVTPLMLAAKLGQVECVQRYLRELGEQDTKGQTALMYAVLSCELESMRLLFDEAGAHDNDGMTALMLAATRGYAEGVELLRERECGLQTADGTTALMMAVIKRHLELLPVLSKELHMFDNGGNSCFTFAQKNDITMYQLLTLRSFLAFGVAGLSERLSGVYTTIEAQASRVPSDYLVEYHTLMDTMCSILLCEMEYSSVATGLGHDLEKLQKAFFEYLCPTSEGTCSVCLSQERTVLLLPCRHLILCTHCSSQLTFCPYCRQNIESTVEIEVPDHSDLENIGLNESPVSLGCLTFREDSGSLSASDSSDTESRD
ncbi:Ankyrin repeat protein 2 [Giardia muris]|uniref:Ankyrin repeat protein 2 n=1 Tax=Giardia muris TaxID=5742 RepID=A0A4Z1T625_GIAMU|nr:Ankyrin repeat protein 2 [Giardia muris]|eukprot:TNJ27979.1 Ankyrin repeat protein 2 [Giardia muris]